MRAPRDTSAGLAFWVAIIGGALAATHVALIVTKTERASAQEPPTCTCADDALRRREVAALEQIARTLQHMDLEASRR